MCNTNCADIFPPAMPKMSVVEWEGVSDSTWLMKAQGGHTKSKAILKQAKEKTNNTETNAIMSGTHGCAEVSRLIS
jgi:hypothetical protein